MCVCVCVQLSSAVHEHCFVRSTRALFCQKYMSTVLSEVHEHFLSEVHEHFFVRST